MADFNQEILWKNTAQVSKRKDYNFTESMKVDGKLVPIVHVQNKPRPELAFKKQSILNNLALKMANKYLSARQKTMFDVFKANTEKITVFKYKEKYVPGIGQNAIEQLCQKSLTVDQIYHKTEQLPLEIHVSHATPISPLNVMLNEGIDAIWDLVDKTTSAVTDYYDNTHAEIGTGTSNTAPVATQTSLQTAPVFKAMDGGYPTSTTQKINFKGTFGSADANQAWEEYAVRNQNATAKELMRATSSKGTKASGEVWTLEIEITGS